MPSDTLLTLTFLFLVVGALYAAVGHAGASGYLAVMALMSVQADVMRPTALAINILVAVIAFIAFARAGHFSWPLFWPFAAASIPFAYLGGRVHVSQETIKVSIGVVLLLAAGRMAWVSLRPNLQRRQSEPPPLWAALLVGAVIGFISGLTGTGGGIFLSPVMLILNWADIKRTAATSALFILVNSISGLGAQISKGWEPPAWLAVLAAAACVGGLVGSYLGARRAKPGTLNIVLAAVLLIAGAKLVFNR